MNYNLIKVQSKSTNKKSQKGKQKLNNNNNNNNNNSEETSFQHQFAIDSFV